MAATAVMLLAASLGAGAAANIEVGWRPLPDGGMQYLIQLDPLTVDILRTGQAIESFIPPQVKDVRGFQIGIGTGKLPRIDPPASPPSVGGQKTTGPANASPKTEPGRPSGLGGFGSLGTAFSGAKGARSESAFGSTSAGPNAPSRVADRPTGPARDESPPPLPANPSSRPFFEKSGPKPPPGKASAATFEQWAGNKEIAEKQSTASPPATGETAPARPWTALTLALAGLFGSLGGNVYLGWLLIETRRRYRAALRRLKRVEAEEWDAPPPGETYRPAPPADSPEET